MPELPADLGHIWYWFGALSATRQSGMGANPITYMEIEAFSRLFRVEITPLEVALIRKLDDMALSKAIKEGDKGSDEIRDAIDPTDSAGAVGLLRGFGVKTKALPKPKAKETA